MKTLWGVFAHNSNVTKSTVPTTLLETNSKQRVTHEEIRQHFGTTEEVRKYSGVVVPGSFIVKRVMMGARDIDGSNMLPSNVTQMPLQLSNQCVIYTNSYFQGLKSKFAR